MNSTVAIVRCESYDQHTVAAAVRRGIDLLGGVAAFTRRGERILLKPNALWATDPARCVVTHPSVLAAVVRVFHEQGTILTYGDSPGGIGQSAATLKRCGFTDAVKGLPVSLVDFDQGRAVSYPAGIVSKVLFLANGAVDIDGIISLPKLKTHGLTTMTCAVKNQFGCVPGLVKGEYHARYPDVFEFSRLLVDITGYLRPRLYIADAVYAMEGNGPQSGDPKPLKCLLLSIDPVALDTVACRIMDCPTEYVPTIGAGKAANLGTNDEKEIEIVGDPVASFIDRSFKIKKVRPLPMPQIAFLRGLRQHFTAQPVIQADKCTRCGRCIQVCPVDPKAIGWRRKKGREDRSASPHYDYRRCIRCFCCHEMCPSRAIVIRRPLLRRLFPFVTYVGLLAAHYNNRRRGQAASKPNQLPG
jgi:uncharacterized protein (DUF362 family)/Pyruvate/2-oxoacid:ferredoxin oxidoreductase delta subunit